MLGVYSFENLTTLPPRVGQRGAEIAQGFEISYSTGVQFTNRTTIENKIPAFRRRFLGFPVDFAVVLSK